MHGASGQRKQRRATGATAGVAGIETNGKVGIGFELGDGRTMDERLRVIVIDDEEGMREGMRRVLERRGLDVELAEDGESAINRLKQGSYDLALVDLEMPGIDGFEVTRFVNETIGNHTVVVIVSALATVEAAVEVTRHGAFDFLVKPFTPLDLMQVVERAARQRILIRERETYLTELNSERTLSRQLINSMHEGVIPGTGLGLAAVKRMVEEYNGRVTVDSTPGEGSTFTVFLPRASD